jgi:BirA family biotin operon repressor/biotin-[acetyl-CoA-carboxylase] ligase
VSHSSLSPPLTLDSIKKHLSTRTIGRTLHLLEETDSTNTAAATLAQQGAEDGTTVVAEFQTAGRGRRGRSWFSPRGLNLSCSVIVLRQPSPERKAQWLSWIPLASALACADAVQRETSLTPLLKWPNDLLVNDRKVGGLLCESACRRDGTPFVVIGIGLNVNIDRDRFPGDLRWSATSLMAETGHSVDRARLLARLLEQVERRLELLASEPIERLRQEYSGRCATLGRRVLVTLAQGERIEGMADSIAENGCLRIIYSGTPSAVPHPELLEIHAGDVLHLR